MDAAIETEVRAWLQDPAIAEPDKDEIRALQASGDDKELTDRFFRRLEFGTGGLRGVIGAGLNRMNLYTVGAAAQGLANCIAHEGEPAKQAGMVIAYDSRRRSRVFAQRVACVMAGNGIRSHLFDDVRPTPELSFAIRHLNATAGVVITASHNPPEYNGFKAFWSDGVQVVPPQDRRIIEEVRGVGSFDNVRVLDFETARGKGLIHTINQAVDEPFLAAVQASCLNPDLCREHGSKLKIVYTNLHGSCGMLIPEALRRRGFEQVFEVPQQADPDGEFPTVASPNPEEPDALAMGIELARREGADLVIGTDPDGDRVGMAVRNPQGDYDLVSGNRIAAMLTFYICEQLQAAGRFPDNAVLVTTIVSGDMMKDIARAYGAQVLETLTGFKWIGQEVCRFESAGSPGRPTKSYIFGGEESYGYMPATFVRDKDAVTSTAFIADMAAWAASRGEGLCELLEGLFRRFGYYHEGAKSLTLKGRRGARQIQAIMDHLRPEPPERIAGLEVSTVADLMSGEVTDRRSGAVVERYDLPESNVLILTLSDATKVIARPSGTEPKIKFYFLTREPAEDLAQARSAATAKINAIVQDLEAMVSAVVSC